MQRLVLAAAAGTALAALGAVAGGCSFFLEFDDFRLGGDAGADNPVQTPFGPALARFDAYHFARGSAARFEVPEERGVLSNDDFGADAGAGRPGGVLRAARLPTAQGGEVRLRVDGSFEYAPPGAAGIFWGDDSFEYTLASTPPSSARVRLTVNPPALVLSELLSNGAGFGVSGDLSRDFLGVQPRSFAAAGDVNGDGLEDFIIGAPGPQGTGDGETFLDGRAAYVLFGKRSASPVALGDLAGEPARGFKILDDDAETLDSFGTMVDSAGDVNGDGFDDVVVVSFSASNFLPGAANAVSFGRAYVVFGKNDADVVSSAEIEAGNGGGFVIYSSRLGDSLFSCRGAGDVNGDGLDDLVVGMPRVGDDDSGAGYVVFGKVSPDPVLTNTLENGGSGGFLISNDVGGRIFGADVAGVGDVDGDGLNDVALTLQAVPEAREPIQAAVVLGRRETTPIALSELQSGASRGFVLTSARLDGGTLRVAAGGDVNGDGFDDILFATPAAELAADGEAPPILNDAGAPDAGDAGAGEAPVAPSQPSNEVGRGILYVSFGGRQPSSSSLTELESDNRRGFAIGGAPPPAGFGYSLATGDVNGDGWSDIVAGTTPGFGPGRAFVIFGKPDPRSFTLFSPEAPPDSALTIIGPADELAGGLVASGSDANGDGLDDLLISSVFYPNAPQAAGGAYVAFSWDMSGALAGRDQALIGTRGDDIWDVPEAPLVIARGGRGRDTLRFSDTTRVLDLTQRGRYESIEIIDLSGNGPQSVRLDETSLRRIPQNHSGFAYEQARRLTVLGDSDDRLVFDASSFRARGGSDGRIVYGKDGVYYGLEVSQELQIVAP